MLIAASNLYRQPINLILINQNQIRDIAQNRLLREQFMYVLRIPPKTMEFVIELLQGIFHKGPTEAKHLMLTIHNKGKAICGCYTYEIAETKIAQAHRQANTAGHPLRCSMDRI